MTTTRPDLASRHWPKYPMTYQSRWRGCSERGFRLADYRALSRLPPPHPPRGDPVGPGPPEEIRCLGSSVSTIGPARRETPLFRLLPAIALRHSDGAVSNPRTASSSDEEGN